MISTSVDEVKATTKADKFPKKMQKFIKEAAEDIDTMNKKLTETVDVSEISLKFG